MEIGKGEMNRKLRCAVVGLGRIGWQFHVPQILTHDGFELVAVVDPVEERLTEAKSQFGVQRLCRRIDELRSGEIDLAVVASPTCFHADQVTYFLEHGVDVFCEKPIAPTFAEAKQLATVAKAEGRRLMLYQPHRLTSECLTAQAIIQSEKLGEIFMLRRFSNGFSRRNDWQALAKNGGGMLLNYGAHYIDQMLYFFHDKTQSVKCDMMAAVTLGDAEDVVQAIIRGESGRMYCVDINMGAALSLPSLVLYGKHGTAMLTVDGEWRVRSFDPAIARQLNMQQGMAAQQRKYAVESLDWIEETFPPVEEQRDEYYNRCRDYFAFGKEPFVPLDETLELMRTIELCRESAQYNSFRQLTEKQEYKNRHE